MSTANPFTKLKEQVEEADRSVAAAAAQGAEELRSMVEEARKHADERAAQLQAKPDQGSDGAEGHWRQVQSDWDQHIKRLRERIDAKKAAVDADAAESDAEWAEDDALDAVAFASAAIEEARYAVLDAVLTRKNADVKAASR
jgi:malate synthase